LFCAAKIGEVEGTVALLLAGADYDFQNLEGRTPLHGSLNGVRNLITIPVASSKGYTEVVAALLLANADPYIEDANGKTSQEDVRGQEGREVGRQKERKRDATDRVGMTLVGSIGCTGSVSHGNESFKRNEGVTVSASFSIDAEAPQM
jgi:hypothetical protein